MKHPIAKFSVVKPLNPIRKFFLMMPEDAGKPRTVPGTRVTDPRGPVTHVHDGHTRPQSHRETSGDQQSQGVGTDDCPSRKASREDARPDLLRGSKLRVPAQEPEGSVSRVKSFQMCSGARIDAAHQDKIKSEQMPHVPRQTSKTGVAKGSEDEWIPINSPGKSQGYLKGEHKRRAEKTETSMMVEHDPQKVHELQAKIAILQRELDQQVSSRSMSPGSMNPPEPLSQEVAYIIDDQPLKSLSPEEEQPIHQSIYERSKTIDEGLTKLSENLLFTQGNGHNTKGERKVRQFHGSSVDLLEVYL